MKNSNFKATQLLKNQLKNNGNKGDPEFRLFENDNFVMMKKLLEEKGEGFAKIIFADVPYNTGAKQSYEDNKNFEQWKIFIKDRLELAHKCLAEDGVIFGFIDDNNQAYFSIIFDEIFGKQNRFPMLIWEKKKPSGSGSSYHNSAEYILVYAKNKQSVKFNERKYDDAELADKNFKFKDEHFNQRGGYQLHDLDKKDANAKDYHRNYAIVAPDGALVYPKKGTVWSWKQELFDFANNNDFIEFVKIKGEWRVKRKRYANVDFHRQLQANKQNSIFKRDAGCLFGNIITGIPTSTGSSDLKKAIGKNDFRYPKPVALIKYLMSMIACDGDELILDIFGGSGTTAQAVAEYNTEHCTAFDCDLITIAEANIPRGVTLKRIKAVQKNNSFSLTFESDESVEGVILGIIKSVKKEADAKKQKIIYPDFSASDSQSLFACNAF